MRKKWDPISPQNSYTGEEESGSQATAGVTTLLVAPNFPLAREVFLQSGNPILFGDVLGGVVASTAMHVGYVSFW